MREIITALIVGQLFGIIFLLALNLGEQRRQNELMICISLAEIEQPCEALK